MKPQELHKAFSQLLGERLKPFAGRDLNLVVCTEVYTAIFEALVFEGIIFAAAARPLRQSRFEKLSVIFWLPV